jgi:hypothetical protein
MIELYPAHGPSAWRRRGWLALIGGAHVLAFFAWKAPERSLAASVAPHQAITYILAPVKPRPALAATAPARPRAAAAVEREARRTVPQPIIPGAPQPITPPAPQAITQSPPPPDPFAEPAPRPADDLMQRSLKSAAAVDRQLRKEAWNPRDKKIANERTVLAAKIDSAYVGSDNGMTTEQLTTTDGRLMTRVRTRGGVFCAYKDSNALTGGRDPFRDGVRTSITTCPR